MGSALARWSMPVWMWSPLMAIWRPHHPLRSVTRRYWALSPGSWRVGSPNGCAPAPRSVSPLGSSSASAKSRCWRISRTAEGTVSCTPETSSIMLVRYSERIGPLTASSTWDSTTSAAGTCSIVCASTTASSHSMPIVDCLDCPNLIFIEPPPRCRRWVQRQSEPQV